MMSTRPDVPDIRLKRITAADVALLRDVRLRALKESPTAFGSSYDVEAQRDPAEWHTRATRWNDPASAAMFIACAGDHGLGMAAGVVGDDRDDIAWLVSMWVDPAVRRRGVGRRLVEAVLGWAALRRGVTQVRLHVTGGNDVAEALYARLGFARTGDRIPHPRYDTLCEVEMVLPMTFTRRAYALCSCVPRGQVTTYAAVAEALGSPGAARAVGNAMRTNPDAPAVPCHRVVGSDGKLTGYAFGLDRKAALLRAEGVGVVDGKADLSCVCRFD